jgi:Predicted nuclease of the RecB family
MAIKQTIWSLDDKKVLAASTLNSENELENLIVDNISLLSDDWLVVGRQVRTFFGGIIDILCIDMGGNPVVVELKKSMTPREVTAQALDYASWVKGIDEDELASIFLKHSGNERSLSEAYKERFGASLSGDNDDRDAQIVIVATEMDGSTERIIKYLQGYGVNINVLFFNVFEYQGKRFLSRAWLFETDQNMKPQITATQSWNGEFYFSYGVDDQRSWDDAQKYGFVSAGGGSWYTNTMSNLEPGNRVWINIPHVGYVGVGNVTEEAKPAREAIFTFNGQATPFFDLELKANYHKDVPQEKEEYIVKIEWLKTIPKNKAVSEYGFFGNQNTVCRPKTDKWDFTIKRLKELWKIE